MKSKIILISAWVFNMFKFKQPKFTTLNFANYIIDNKPFFLISWSFKHGYKFQIRAIQFTSFKKSGSAYIAVPENIHSLNLKLSSSWKSESQTINLEKVLISDKIDFILKPHFSELTRNRTVLPNISTYSKELSLKPLNFRIANTSRIEIKNLEYH